MLHCQHTFHKDCLKELIKNTGNLNCPVCRKHHEISIFENLHKNIWIADRFSKRSMYTLLKNNKVNKIFFIKLYNLRGGGHGFHNLGQHFGGNG